MGTEYWCIWACRDHASANSMALTYQTQQGNYITP